MQIAGLEKHFVRRCFQQIHNLCILHCVRSMGLEIMIVTSNGSLKLAEHITATVQMSHEEMEQQTEGFVTDTSRVTPNWQLDLNLSSNFPACFPYKQFISKFRPKRSFLPRRHSLALYEAKCKPPWGQRPQKQQS